MLKKIMFIIEKVESALKRSPMEILLGCVFFVFWLIARGNGFSSESGISNILPLFPVFFVVTFVCNNLFKGGLRFLYYLSGLLFIPFLFIPIYDFIRSSGYWFSWLIAIVALVSYGWHKNNIRFTWNAVKVVVDFSSAAFISGTLFLAVIAIHASIAYIFNLDGMLYSNFNQNMFLLTCFVIQPIFFLAFNGYKIETESRVEGGPVFNIFISYILSPAVIIYTCILYVYFAKIAILWELPKGNIAYMVFAFIISAIVGQACHQLLEKRRYDWFYNYFSWISFPPLIIFWIGVIYRIRQYGFTDDRVYLLVCGLLMTLCILLFLNKHTGKYSYVSVLTVVSLSLITFVPPISAERLGLYSQQRRLDKFIKELGIAGADGKLVKIHADNDTIRKKAYREFYEAFDYVSNNLDSKQMLATYGYDKAYEMRRDVIPATLSEYVMWGGDTSLRNSTFWIKMKQSGVQNISGFKYVYPFVNNNDKDNLDVFYYSYSFMSPVLEIKNKELETILSLDMNDYLKQVLDDKVLKDRQSTDVYTDSLFYDADFGRIVFKEIELCVDSVYDIYSIGLDYLLTK